MLYVIAVLSSIILTSQSAWSQDAKVTLYGVEVIDAREMSPAQLNLTLQKSLTKFAEKEKTAYELVSQNLREQGLSSDVKKIIVLNPYDSGENYTTTLLTAKLMSGAYDAPDKVKHVQFGYGIGLAGTVAIRNQLNGVFDRDTANLISRGFGAMLACFTGAGKEWLYDRKNTNRHTVDRKDFYATCAGGFNMFAF